ncbi:MAG TPA: hypothetical protein PLJ78_05640 [Anaerolineae bacterium]|nr:hypothetical protein [Anaerolineae bacterium]HQK13409.1 hypothetical protein [Anaerolineae bacterium]
MIWGIVWLALIALYLIAPLRHLDGYAWDYDEGPYLQAAALAFQGHPLYAKVVLNKLPYLTWILEVSFALGGITLTTARFTVLLLTLTGFVSLGILAELWWGEGAGPATMAILLLIPEFSVRAAVVMNDLPAMSAALVALTAATLFRRTHRLGWLLTGAVAYVFAVGLHPLLLFTGLPVVWILVAPKPHAPFNLHHGVRVTIIFGVTAFIIGIGTLLLVDDAGLIRWVYAYNTTSAKQVGMEISTWGPLRDYLLAHWILVVIALSGSLLLRRRFWLGVSLIWTFLTWLTLYLYRPLWEHYLIFLLYPLIILAGGGVATGVKEAFQTARHSIMRRSVAPYLLCLTLLFGFQRLSTPSTWPAWPKGQAEAYTYVAQAGAPGQFIVTDNQFLAFVHGYRTPPALADTSFKRIRNDYLEIGQVVQAIRDYAVEFLVVDRNEGRFVHFPEFMQGIEAIAAPPHCFAAFCVYRVRPVEPAEAMLGNAVRLVGYTLTPAQTVRSGETLTVTLYWQSIAPVDADLSVFTHLVDAEDALVIQHDGPPLLGNAPTSTWRAGMVIPDPHPIIIGADVAPAVYNLIVGMYHWPSGERLPALNAVGERWRDDRIPLTSITVSRP